MNRIGSRHPWLVILLCAGNMHCGSNASKSSRRGDAGPADAARSEGNDASRQLDGAGTPTKALTLPWVPSRDVRASLVVGDTLYIGGLFDRIQRHVGPLALFDAEGALISSPRGVSLPRLS
jgi:hypothetical protein